MGLLPKLMPPEAPIATATPLAVKLAVAATM
jgi:hypothetical protein